MKEILIATTNIGKAEIYRQAFDGLNVKIVTLNDIGEFTAPEENGKNAIENAVIKAKYYHSLTNLPVIANDAGLIIHKFSKQEQAGLFVRREGTRELNDEELIVKFSEKLKSIGGKSTGHYNVGLAIINEQGKLFTKHFAPKVLFVSTPSEVVKKGVPLDSLAYVKKAKKYKSEMSIEDRNKAEGKSFTNQLKFIRKHLK